MARKTLTPEKEVALRYRKWIREFPDQEPRQKVAAFDRIADEVLKNRDSSESTDTGRNGF
jgi:hypothetical protein